MRPGCRFIGSFFVKDAPYVIGDRSNRTLRNSGVRASLDLSSFRIWKEKWFSSHCSPQRFESKSRLVTCDSLVISLFHSTWRTVIFVHHGTSIVWWTSSSRSGSISVLCRSRFLSNVRRTLGICVFGFWLCWWNLTARDMRKRTKFPLYLWGHRSIADNKRLGTASMIPLVCWLFYWRLTLLAFPVEVFFFIWFTWFKLFLNAWMLVLDSW